MEVILLEKVGKMGVLGDTVNVKSGYARAISWYQQARQSLRLQKI